MAADVTAVDGLRPVVGDAPGAPDPTPDNRLRRATHTANAGVQLAVGTAYALLVTALWIPFGPRSGMGYETTLVYISKSSSFFEGFLYDDDPLPSLDLLLRDSDVAISVLFGIASAVAALPGGLVWLTTGRSSAHATSTGHRVT